MRSPLRAQMRIRNGVSRMISSGLIDWNQVAGIVHFVPKRLSVRSV